MQGLRDVGWSDAQIAEAVYVGALFSLFVRLADAFDIHPNPMMDPDGRPKGAMWAACASPSAAAWIVGSPSSRRSSRASATISRLSREVMVAFA